MLNRAFWAATAERAIKTAAQTLFAALAMASAPVDILRVNWVGVLSVTAGATLLSVLTSLASVNVGTPGTPAAVGQEAAAADPFNPNMAG